MDRVRFVEPVAGIHFGEKIMKSLIAATAAIVLLATGTAQASSLLFSQTVVPVSTSGNTTFFDDDNDFSVGFDFSTVANVGIDRFELTLQASGARNEFVQICLLRCRPLFYEDWNIRVQGSQSGSSDDVFASIQNGENGYTFTAASDVGAIDAFAHSASTGLFTVWLSEGSSDMLLRNPRITVSSLTLNVYGTAVPAPSPVPLPAGLPLLLAGLGGMAALRLRRGRAV
jgi:hypothetical protein